MARGDLKEAEYMARRALGLLLTYTGSSKAVEIEVSFQPQSGESPDPLRRPSLKLVLHLLNTWLAMKGLFSGVLPFLEDRFHWVETETPDEEAPTGEGRIDWQATFAHLASGRQGAVMRSRRKVREERTHHYVALLLAEVALHGRELRKRFEDHDLPRSSPLAGMLSDIQAHIGRVRELLSSERFRSHRPPEETLRQIRGLYAADLDDPDSERMFEAYRAREEQLVGNGPRQFAVNQVTRRLCAWRDQYLAGRVWLADTAGLTLSVGRLDGLYELWCFAEMMAKVRRLGLGRAVQNSFLRRGQPAVELGPDYYAYYDFDAHAFRSVASDRLFRTKGAPTPALPGAHVEWFIRDTADYRNSMVLDTKYYKQGWSSGQALKVLGYMQNFGVRRGAVVFSGGLEALEGVAEPLEPGLFRLPCPTEDRSVLWVLQMSPEPEAESKNSVVLDRFLEETLGSGTV